MKNSNFIKLLFLLGIPLLISLGCEKETLSPSGIDFYESIAFSTDPEQAIITNGPQIIDSSVVQTAIEICITRNIRWNESFAELQLLGEHPFGIGTPIVPTSVTTGEYQIFPSGERAPFCWSTNLPVSRVKGTHQGELSAYRQALSDYLEQGLLRPVPITADYSFDFVYNEQQLSKAIGASLKVGKWVNISGSYDFTSSGKSTKVIVRFVQPYFQIDADPVTSEEFYSTPPTLEEMERYGVDEYGLLYLSKIVMGRQLYLMMESNDSREDVEKALNSELNFWKVNGDFEYSEENAKIIKNSKLRVIVMGGDGTGGPEVITNGLKGVAEFIKRGASFDPKVNPGVPLSYQLKRLKDNTVFNTVIASEYPVRECEAIPPIAPFVKTIQLNQMGPFCPPLVRGDREVGDSGEITAETELYILDGNQLWAKIHYKIYEVRADHSTAQHTWRVKLFTAPNGQKINKIISPTRSHIKYRDYDHGIDIFEPDGPVFQFLCIGDTPGWDLGNCTGPITNVDNSKLGIKWKPIKLEIQP